MSAYPRRRRLWDVVTELRRPRVAVMLALGVSSGLPFMLIGNTLGFWLADDGISLVTIGALSWVGLSYSVKFLWGAMADRLTIPGIGWLGRRRSWMLLSQLLAGASLAGMGLVDPKRQLAWLVGLALAAAIGAATQDTAIDAWRIETADDADELGLLTAAYTLGFRVALIFTEAVILTVAKRIGWPASYVIYGGAMLIGVAATLIAKEPAAADAVMEAKSREGRRHPAWAAYDAVVGPLVTFFRTHGLVMAALMLSMITFYHLCDYMRGPMTNPYYKALAIDKDVIASVRLIVGTPFSFLGVALGGLCSLRLGNMRTLVIGAVLQPVAVGAFAILGWHGGDYMLLGSGRAGVTAFEAVMAFDGFAMSFAGVALVTYMSTLTSLGYTATQYALLTSALAWTGKILKGFSGSIVQGLEHGRSVLDAFATFYLLAAAVGAPAIVLCLILARRRPRSPQLNPL